MGGNVTALTKSGQATRAQKIPLKDIGRAEFVKTIQQLLKALNKGFYKKYHEYIWKNEKEIMNGYVFNGSTSFIMNPKLVDSEIVQYKPLAGDIDVTVPENLAENLWKYLDSVEDTEIIKNVIYKGCNRPTVSSIGDQINTVFLVKFDKVQDPVACQIDFELLEYVDDKPSEWAKFSHSSSFEDAKIGVKSVHHKYILRALVGGSSIRKDIVITTSTSTPNNIKLSKSKVHEIPRMLKFSVTRGIRTAYEPMLDSGKPVYKDGKQVYKEIPSKTSDYVTNVMDIFKLSFGDVDEADEKLFYSFDGIIKLMKKYLTKEQIKNTYDRYVELLWGLKPQRAQELEVNDPETDAQVKLAGYNYLIKELGLRDQAKDLMLDYYADYGHRQSKGSDKLKESYLKESFIDFLRNTGFI